MPTLEALKGLAPTDNLYKFLALFGLGLIAIGAFLQWSRYDAYSRALSEFGYIQQRYYTPMPPGMQRELSTLRNDLGLTYRDIDSGFADPVLLAEYMRGMRKIVTSYDDIKKPTREDIDTSLPEDIPTPAVNVAKLAYERVGYLCTALYVTGAVVSGLGFACWYLVLQRTENAKSRLERFKAERELAELRTAGRSEAATE